MRVLKYHFEINSLLNKQYPVVSSTILLIIVVNAFFLSVYFNENNNSSIKRQHILKFWFND